MSEKGYIVVFKNTKACGGYAGIRTWTSLESKEAFDKWFDEEMRSHKEVVEEGVTREEAILLVHKTPASCRIAVALEEAIDPESGERDEDMFRLELAEALFAIKEDDRHRQ